MEKFEIDVAEAVLTDLRDRVRNTRWPDPAPGEPWAQGTDETYLRDLLTYWADGYDWQAQERELNRFAHFRTTLDGTRVHFVHARATGGGGIPLVLTNGWPSTFAELLPLVPLLTDPAAHGIDGPAFDLVLPSLPGYGFSARPPRTGVTYRYVAGLWHRLMRELGYERYAAGGSDFGAGVATYMGLDDPAPLIGLHFSTPEIPPYTGPGSRPLSEAERAYREGFTRWGLTERGYQEIQSTKPQTLGYGLADSPPAWPPGSSRSGVPGPTRPAPSTATSSSPPSRSTGSPARSRPRCATTTTTGGSGSRSGRTTSWTCRRASPSSTSTSPTRATCRASGWNASSPSAAGRLCPGVATSRPPRLRSCWPPTSPPSSARYGDRGMTA
ncbi:epoxide hydrolase family protein [Phytohabitans flavus]|uniref:epoxide hydrolase family protein n=1 Tax=Phytohabitans flavus TaxID=1076124 RepID=UPI00362FDCCC